MTDKGYRTFVALHYQLYSVKKCYSNFLEQYLNLLFRGKKSHGPSIHNMYSNSHPSSLAPLPLPSPFHATSSSPCASHLASFSILHSSSVCFYLQSVIFMSFDYIHYSPFISSNLHCVTFLFFFFFFFFCCCDLWVLSRQHTFILKSMLLHLFLLFVITLTNSRMTLFLSFSLSLSFVLSQFQSFHA